MAWFKLNENSLFAILLRARWWVSLAVGLGVFAVVRLFLDAGFAFFAFPPSARILIPSLLLPALSLYVLFRPVVNDYFIAISSGNFPDQQ